jgi:hypothetical protein
VGADGGAADLAATPGPGPLGALPTGYCCSANEQCRSRNCINLDTGPYYCADPCTAAAQCSGWSTSYGCDAQNMICYPVNSPYACLDGAAFSHGALPTGACCDGGAGPTLGADCAGGLCLHTGAASDPYYCSQGCNDATPCPSGYACHAAGITTGSPGQCWKSDPSRCG